MADEDDDLFDDLEIDESVLRAIDDIEAQQVRESQLQPPSVARAVVSANGPVAGGSKRPIVAAGFQRNHGRPLPVAQRSISATATSSRPYTTIDGGAPKHIDLTADPLRNTDSMGNFIQKDLFGNPIAPKVSNTINAKASTSNGKQPPWNANSAAAVLEANAKVKAIVIKKWDHTRHAKSGAVRKNSKGKAPKSKGKGKARKKNNEDDDDDIDEFDEDEEEDFNMDDDDDGGIAGRTIGMKIKPDRKACETFVYPLNKDLRKYQYDIVTKAFYTDTLVALPTGLGKTFLAAVLMLNFYRWFPEGKLIFMAPSRPLVTQQIAACHGIAGIPLRDAVELTGKDNPEKRAEQWRKRRVFYCTPQTVKNDLLKRRVDPCDIVCIVVDEAHKATGDYAYTEVVRYMMRKNPNFRLLALTATPGGDPDAVQTVVDNLHIGNIEVRTDESLDIRPYVHTKKVELVVIPVDGEIESIRERFAGLMDIILKPLAAKGLFNIRKDSPTSIHPYAFQSAQQRVRAAGQPHAIPDLLALGTMARCIAKLLMQSVSAFYESLKELKAEPKGKLKVVIQHPNFASILRDAQDIVGGRDFEGHPKMVKLRELVLAHFQQAEKAGTIDSTRIMVFCSFREVVEEIVERLNRSEGIRATRLVGQGSDTKGKKGLAQKQQNQVLSDFKKGTYNVLVATSIGEEGLDIGELDLIICYEAPKSSIRTLQRAGRTGRARDGKVIVLMTEGNEDSNWKSANDSYKGVQNAIVSGRQFELYADCQRLIPNDIRPLPDKRALVIETFDPEKMGIDSQRPASKAKRKAKVKNDEDGSLSEPEPKKTAVRKQKPKVVQSDSLDAEDEPEAIEEEARNLGPPGATKDEKTYLRRFTKIPDILRANSRARLAHTLTTSVQNADAMQSRQIHTTARVGRLMEIFANGRRLSADPQRYKQWQSDTYPHFRNSNVEWWSDSKVGTGRDRSFRTMSIANSVQSGTSSATAGSSLAATTVVPHKMQRNDMKPDDANTETGGDDDDDLPELPRVVPSKIGRNLPTSSIAGQRHKTAVATFPLVTKKPAIDTKQGLRGASAKVQVQPVVIDLSDDSGPEDAEFQLAQKLATPAHKIDSKRLTATDPQSTGLPPAVVYTASKPTAAIDLVRGVPSPGAAAIFIADVQSSPPGQVAAVVAPKVYDDTEGSSIAVVTRNPRKRLVVDEETSSPDKAASALRAVKMRKVVQSSSPEIKARKVGKLVRAVAGSARSSASPAREPVKQMKLKTRKLPGDQCPYFDTRAINSDDPESETDSELDGDGHPESAGDRQFVDSDDVANPRDMSAFYRESLMTQANHHFAGAPHQRGAYKLTKRNFTTTKSADPEASQWNIGSFVVEDEDEIVYTDEDDGLPHEGTSDMV